VRKRLRSDVVFGVPVCLCREEDDGAVVMWTVSGTVSGLTEFSPYFRGEFERFSSVEEAEVAASVRGIPFLSFENTGGCVAEDPVVVGFIGRWNPEAVFDVGDS